MKVVPILLLVVALSCGCRKGMYNQAKIKPYDASELFKNGSGMRQPPPGTVPAGSIEDSIFTQGIQNDGVLVTALPLKLDMALLDRGRERFDIYCAVCHGATGTGDGMIVQRGFPQPPSYHIERLREAPLGYFVNVIANGYGAMYSYAARVDPRDRWAIAAYIRALQLSRNATLDDVPARNRAKLEAAP
jgi:mono/diheme cytochrome c family protein